MIRYFDTSALVPYYRPEPLSDTCERLITGEGEILLSDLTIVEMASTLARLVRTGELTENDVLSIEARFEQHLAGSGFRVVPMEPRHYVQARERLQLRSTALRSLDALHLSVASEWKATLVTADKPLATAAEHFSISVMWLVAK